MNEKSIYKKLVCPTCKGYSADFTGKGKDHCFKCGQDMLPSIKWYVRLTRNGKTVCRAISTRRQDAVDYLHAAKDAVRRGAMLPGEEKPVQWADAKKDFLTWVDGASLADKTVEFYKSCFNHLDKFFDEPLQSVTVKRVEAYRDSRKAAPKTVAEEIKTLKRIFSLQCRWNSARTAPQLHAVAADLAKVEMPTYNNKRTRFLTVKETGILLDTCPVPHLKVAIQVALGTGWRKGMICGLQWKQIDFVNSTVTFMPKDMKSGRVFVAPLMGAVADLLKDWRKQQSQKCLSPFVFPSPSKVNQAMADMQKSWDNLIVSLGWHDVVFHTLRHTFASHFLMSGGDLATLSELLDHASIQITKDRYGHLSGEHKQKAVEAFSGVFFKTA